MGLGGAALSHCLAVDAEHAIPMAATAGLALAGVIVLAYLARVTRAN